MDTRLYVKIFEEIFKVVTEAANVVHEEMWVAVRETTSGMVHTIGSASPTSSALIDICTSHGQQLDARI